MPRDSDLQVTETDRSVLGPLAEHRILITPQLAMALNVSYETAARRLRRLRGAGLISYGQVMAAGPGVASITRRGLDLIEDHAPVPNIDLRGYRHDVGLGWLWLAAHNGGFGSLSSVVTERAMRASDAAGQTTAEGPAHGLGLGLLGPNGHPQRHYPDLLLHTRTGHRIAVELELTAKSSRRMSRIMTAYATDPRIDAVVYLVPTRRLATLVSDAARRAGIGDLVAVQALAADRIQGVGAIGARSRDATGARTTSRGTALPGAGTSPRREPGLELGAGR